jgi:6-phosphogluconolactonase (cycloisomerase 2 family)
LNCGAPGAEVLYGAPAASLLNTFVTADINPATGGFSSISITTPPLFNSAGIVALNGEFLYVSANGAGLLGFEIDSTTGSLTALGGSPFLFSPGRAIEQLTAVPKSSLFYAADSAGGVDAFQVNNSTGVPSAVAGSPFGSGKCYEITADPLGKFVYASDYSDGAILGFTVSTTGALTPIPGSPVGLPGAPTSMPRGIVDTGDFVYVALSGTNEIAGFSIDAKTGALTAVPGSPFPSAAVPTNLAQSNDFLYEVSGKDGSVSGYSISPSSGALTAIPGSPFFHGIATMVADPSGKYLYLSSSVGIIGSNIDSSTGALTLGAAALSNDGSLSLTIVQLPSAAAQHD